MSDLPGYTIGELLEMNNGQFPFWVTNCDPRHFVAKVTGFVFIPWKPSDDTRPWRKAIKAQFPDTAFQPKEQKPTTYYLCEIYRLDNRNTPLSFNSRIISHDEKCWLPA